ncbi:serine hydrolase [uncultured Erythrobacter sp.]|uniref:serine hydrolase n=1 Tax=uncultured Erythrobacter sp. TaxID=263913 RepID=UPI0026135B17|nr:serine hydrolase [uncultured Erythrobacter sp.]
MKFTRRAALLLSPALAAFAALPATAQDAERMVEVVEEEVEAGAFMGAVLVAKDGTVLVDQAWGSANLELSVDNSSLTKFRIGSVTKQFTAASILLLQEQGKLTLDDPISQHMEGTPEAWSGITLRHLLHHTAGLPNVTSLDGFGRLKYLPTTQDELIATFSELPLEFEPGSDWKYSNSGYVLLSRVVETASGKSYSDFLSANLLDPLGMKETGLDRSSTILPKRASGYSPSSEGVVNADYVDMGIPTGAGAMYSTTGDLLKWQRGLFGGQVLSAESLAEYTTPSPLEAIGDDKYALGVIVEDDEDGKAYWHGGGIEGFNAWLGYDPDNKATVVVLANLNGGTASKLGGQLMQLARGAEITLPDERVATELAPADFAQYEGVYAVAPTFKITVFQDDGKLMAQATGQDAFQIFAEGPDRFFLKVVDAQVRFERGEDGTVKSLTLFQGGQELPAPKE